MARPMKNIAELVWQCRLPPHFLTLHTTEERAPDFAIVLSQEILPLYNANVDMLV